MIRKLLKPLVVAARDGSVVLVTLPAEANVEFDPVPNDNLTDDDLTEVVYHGDYYLARSEDLLDAVGPRCVGRVVRFPETFGRLFNSRASCLLSTGPRCISLQRPRPSVRDS